VTDENLSKRERQKQRREAKRQAEQAEQAKARRRRLGGYALVALVVLGLVGLAVGRTLADRRAQEQRAEEVAQRLEDIGCGEIEQIADMGRGHFSSAEELAVADPDMIYSTRPATSGRHMGQVAITGVYDKKLDERLIIHNLEHGYVVLWHDDEADPDQVDAMKSWAQERIEDGFPKIILAEYHETLPAEGNFAAVAWDHRQVCEEFDEDVFQVFLDNHHDSPDVPEPRIPAHRDPEQAGAIDPDAMDGDALFPPLGQAGVEGEGDIDEEPDMAPAEDPDPETGEDAGDGTAPADGEDS
jgi:hypothetical protein